MSNNIYVDANPYEARVALVEDGNLAELYVERHGGERIVGNIYKGIVKNVLPGMQAAFVDIGLERNAFLYAGDILQELESNEQKEETKEDCPDIRSLVKVGQDIMVQVLKEPFGTKGARISTNITLPGRLLVMLPQANYIGVSRRIEDEEERERLRTLLEEIRPENMGMIARTVSKGMQKEEFLPQIKEHMQLYQEILQQYESAKAPSLVHSEDNLLYRAVRDLLSADIDKVEVNSLWWYEKMKEVAESVSPHLAERIKLFDQHYDIFKYYDLEGQIEKALARRVWLKSGGYLIIDFAEALTVVDVNTGKYVGSVDLQETILKTNIEAAEEVARQIRLRDISGIIVVDFIDMEEEENREKILEVMKEAVKRDRTRTTILGMTDLGIVELTRKKVRQSIGTVFYGPCPYCNGSGTILSTESMAMKARKEVLRMYSENQYDNIVIKAAAAVCAEIQSKMKPDKLLIPPYAGKQVYLLPWDNMHIEHMEVFGKRNTDVIVKSGGERIL